MVPEEEHGHKTDRERLRELEWFSLEKKQIKEGSKGTLPPSKVREGDRWNQSLLRGAQ